MQLIYFLESIIGKIAFSIGEYEFEGCRPIPYMDLPWKNNKEMDEYNNSLSKENTRESYKKYIYWDKQYYYEKMHMAYSRSILCAIAGIIFLILSGILLSLGNGKDSPIAIVASIIMMVLFLYLKFRAKKYYTELGMGQILYNSFDTWPADEN